MRRKESYVIAVDVDEVCADLLTEWIVVRYNRMAGAHLTLADITAWDMKDVVPEEWVRRTYMILEDEDLYDGVKPFPGALEAINRLREQGHRVVFASSCVVGSYDAKVRWLIRNGFVPDSRTPKDVYLCGDKSLVNADILIDDGLHNLDTFPGWRILVTRPHNANAIPKWKHWRVSSLADAANRIERYLKPKEQQSLVLASR